MNDIENCVRNIRETFGPGKRCLGKDWRINFDEKELQDFVGSLSEDNRRFLSKLIVFFWYHMRPLYWVQNGNDSLDKVLGKTVWSTFALVTMMSVLDSCTKGSGYKRKDFTELLLENIPITSEQQLKELSESHKKGSPHPSIKRLCDLFQKNLDPKEIKQITQDYLSEKRSSGELKLDTFEDVVSHLWGEVRSGFIHDVGIESIYNESTVFSKDETKPDTIIVHSNLSMSNFLFLSWKAIFRDLGYRGDMNCNFTDEEKKNRLTADGTKL